MIKRTYWSQRVTSLLQEKNILYLCGVHSIGKTTLCQSFPDAIYWDCELPRVRRQLEDPEVFFHQYPNQLLILDEIHRLSHPSEILKIAADHFPNTKVIATGPSTLAPKNKFKDTLTGRKNQLWLTPIILQDLENFKDPDLHKRMIHGGLPYFFMSKALNDTGYKEWIDSYWSKDLQELFVIDKKSAFLKFTELLFLQSGELFSAQPFASTCEISRQTIQNYLHILETTLLMTVLRPYTGGSANEIKSQPKVYGFDTGFVSYFRGWDKVTDDNKGVLLEHLVLNQIQAQLPSHEVFYWRDKQKHEIDFILKKSRSQNTLAIECKANSGKWNGSHLEIYRRYHPHGENWVICLNLVETEVRSVGNHTVRLIPFQKLHTELDLWTKTQH